MLYSTYAFRLAADDNCCGPRLHQMHVQPPSPAKWYISYLGFNVKRNGDRRLREPQIRTTETCNAAQRLFFWYTYCCTRTRHHFLFHFFLALLLIPILTRNVIFEVVFSFFLRYSNISSKCWQPTNLMQQFGVITLGLNVNGIIIFLDFFSFASQFHFTIRPTE